MDRFPLGFNTYSVRAMRWPDLKLLEYGASLKLDAVYLQDSTDPLNNDPAHWKDLNRLPRAWRWNCMAAMPARCRARPTA